MFTIQQSLHRAWVESSPRPLNWRISNVAIERRLTSIAGRPNFFR
jgi:hypothetical protein